MKVLVTGSAGHLGEALVRTLRARGEEVVSIDLLESPYTSHVGSITDRSFVAHCMRGVEVVIHAATLHKPHVATHSRQDFVDTNVTGTLHLLEEARAVGVSAFIFTSTTSTFGHAMKPSPGDPAIWVTEAVVPQPKNIYGITKLAAENLCKLFHDLYRMPCLVLRTSRFFPEDDDNQSVRSTYDGTNAKVNEFLYRRVDVEDAVTAHLLAIERAPALGFDRFIISATTPFSREDLDLLGRDAAKVAARYVDFESEYAERGWRMFPTIDRVYVNDRARSRLGWRPKYDFATVVARLESGEDPLSPLAAMVGTKGYHAKEFAEGPYPVDESHGDGDVGRGFPDP
ncbi:NAD(P)-dependent oxidoreductase [Sulfidibacter corallicola]|uniref:NAD(P)-dependent oxidoreductase n=1 Tax=Sulfidibacter corallicola TaxID=2818388 RepID=A0A8A4TFP5_SULCO|nr:NAD(P)-dependent oxidoreductase [Sulfidibacter corallicola]QTD48347.1 NAD(P)-dependent oxidoreductase [Sulfidibacter corallicola]